MRIDFLIMLGGSFRSTTLSNRENRHSPTALAVGFPSDQVERMPVCFEINLRFGLDSLKLHAAMTSCGVCCVTWRVRSALEVCEVSHPRRTSAEWFAQGLASLGVSLLPKKAINSLVRDTELSCFAMDAASQSVNSFGLTPSR